MLHPPGRARSRCLGGCNYPPLLPFPFGSCEEYSSSCIGGAASNRDAATLLSGLDDTRQSFLKQVAHPFGFSLPRGPCSRMVGMHTPPLAPDVSVSLTGHSLVPGARLTGSWTETPPRAPLYIMKNHRDNPGVAPFHSAKIKHVTGAFHWNEDFISMILRSATVHGFSYWAANIFYQTLT